jgi:hypothetical protein
MPNWLPKPSTSLFPENGRSLRKKWSKEFPKVEDPWSKLMRQSIEGWEGIRNCPEEGMDIQEFY